MKQRNEHIVSWSNSIYKKPDETRDLIDWVLSNEHKKRVLAYRAGKIKKDQLPIVTPAGLFHDGKTMKHFIKSSGLIFVDVDKCNVDKLKAKIDVPWVKLISRSSGGNGLSIFIPIDGDKVDNADKPNEVYAHYYRLIEDRFKQIGINLDKSCKNINRLRYASFDDDIYYNKKATLFPWIEPVKREVKITEIKIDGKLKREIMNGVELIERKKIDITKQYNDWLYCAGIFYHVFGVNQGLNLFIRVSRFHPDFNEDECERKYMSCLSFPFSSPERFFNLIKPKAKIL